MLESVVVNHVCRIVGMMEAYLWLCIHMEGSGGRTGRRAEMRDGISRPQ